ncbi:MAG TPA: winged helix DNA-binding domain-containing protein [Gemmatimonadaceae bacterium]|nr:winged helix DNA-binding domain-containing protein [Gemmatimonadaceae bacterium]
MLTRSDILRRRLAGLQLMAPTLDDPAAVVARLGAVQAQDYAGAKWAVGQRTRGATDATVERAVGDGSILRTHVLRPTWHFVAPADIRWMLALTAPRVRAASASRWRELGLDDAVFRRSRSVFTKALRGGQQRTRTELGSALERAGIDLAAEPQRLPHLLMRAELDGLIVSGARRGKQSTYALLEERVPPAEPMERDAALCELATRYFATRGPATLQDFAWWSGLTVADARRGVEAAGSALSREEWEGRPHWFAGKAARWTRGGGHLLPNYDEYVVAYRDRSAIMTEVQGQSVDARGNLLFSHLVVAGGRVLGVWRRLPRARAAFVELTMLTPTGGPEPEAIREAARKYAAFLELPLEVAEV